MFVTGQMLFLCEASFAYQECSIEVPCRGAMGTANDRESLPIMKAGGWSGTRTRDRIFTNKQM